MTPVFSTYLDGVRIVAALIVLLSHTLGLVFPDAPLIPLPGHYAVTVFFVLSGFVIALVTDTRDFDGRIYALNRLSRVWSVAIPAVFLCAVVELAGGGSVTHTPMLYPFHPEDLTGVIESGCANVFFVAQNWSMDLLPGVNPAFWSLNNEAWYYLIFGVFRYLRGWSRLPMTALFVLLAGPKIMLVMPCWLVGVWLYHYRARLVLSPRLALAVALGSIILMAILIKSGVAYDLKIAFKARISIDPALDITPDFVIEFIVALLFALHLHAVQFVVGLNGIAAKAAKAARIAASFTFSTYLYHLPLFVLLWDVLGIHHWVVYPIMAAAIVGLGFVTEHRRSWLRARLDRLARFFGRAWMNRVA